MMVALAASVSTAWTQEPVRLYAAGGLRAAMSDIAAEFERVSGIEVRGEYGPSGLLRGRIEQGEPAEVFASANMTHPQTAWREWKELLARERESR